MNFTKCCIVFVAGLLTSILLQQLLMHLAAQQAARNQQDVSSTHDTKRR